MAEGKKLSAFWRRKWLVALTIVLLWGLGEYWVYPLLVSGSGTTENQGRNGIWLRYKWYFGENTDFQELADKLNHGGFRYAFFHVRSVDRDGSLHFRHAESAQRLNREVRHRAPETLRIAWIFAGNRAAHGEVDLSLLSVRKKMVEEARWLVAKCGFDGIQWDYEICPDRDRWLLRLLEETRQALPRSFISVAVPSAYSWPFTGLGWSAGYYHDVGQLVDQIAVMGYDTGAYFPRWYMNHVHGSIRIISGATYDTRCSVLMGLPTYEDGPPSHNPHSENLRLGIRGVKHSRLLPPFEGIALFADYTTDDDEWQLYSKEWLGQ